MVLAEAPLANAPTPVRPLGYVARRRAARRNWIDAIPLAAYEQPVHVMGTLMGPLFLISDPEGVRRVLLEGAADYPKHAVHLNLARMIFGEGLLTSEGETWRAHRRLMSPSFEPRAVAGCAPAMAAAIEAFAQGWEAMADGSTIDIADEMLALALRVISLTLFSTDSQSVMALAGEAMRQALAIRPNLLDLLPVVGPSRKARNARRIAGVFGALDAAVAALVAGRAAPDAPQDFLGRLVAARDSETGARLSPREVRDQVVTIFLAGHETTAVALTWIWYVLSQRPEAEARLLAELEAVLQGRAPEADDLPRLTYARALIQEVMRLYPPVPNLLARRATRADVVCGVRIPKGSMVGVAPWIVHRHRRLWDDPDGFDPDRFLRPAERPRLAYMPFGAGPRTCIDAQLAMNEITLALAMIAPRWRLAPAPGETVELQHRVTLRSVGGLKMVLTRR